LFNSGRFRVTGTQSQIIMNLIHTTEELDEVLSRPTAAVCETLRRVPGDVVVLGAGGKLGPSLAAMLRRASDQIGESSRRVIAVSRFSSPAAVASLQRAGVETLACDLTDRRSVDRLPEVPNVICLIGQKFGTSQSPELTWITNTLAPALIAERFCQSRIVALSTGCVYPLAPVDGPGCSEGAPLGPPGEYANSCVGRERMFEHFSKRHGTPTILVRLCYAIDLRYGVLLDLAQKIYSGLPVDLDMGYTHVIWQGDANARIIQCLEHTCSPAVAVNVTGLERLSIRALAMELAEKLNREPLFTGVESKTAWLWDATRSYEWFGPPEVSIGEMLSATADWVLRGGETLNRPTHFEVRDGQF
jgi:nucleoside-diphosphate-sugar epimerase